LTLFFILMVPITFLCQKRNRFELYNWQITNHHDTKNSSTKKIWNTWQNR